MAQEKTITARLATLHPVNTLMEEHQFILKSVRELGAFVERLQARPGFPEMAADLEVLKGIAHHLVDAESHHDREEEVLFPRMVAHGVTDLPARMKADHAEFRKRKRRLYQVAQVAGTGDFSAFKTEVTDLGRFIVRELTAHIATEDDIVYPRALEVLDSAEWDEVKRGCDAVGYCCFKPADQRGEEIAAGAPAHAPAAPAPVELDLRGVPMFRRLETVLKSWADLERGRSIRITNDKKPEPLQVLFRTKENGRHEWRYEKEGPADWVATIRKL